MLGPRCTGYIVCGLSTSPLVWAMKSFVFLQPQNAVFKKNKIKSGNKQLYDPLKFITKDKLNPSCCVAAINKGFMAEKL